MPQVSGVCYDVLLLSLIAILQSRDPDLAKDLNPFGGRAYDELYTPKQVVQIVKSLNLIKNPIQGPLVA